MRKPVVAKMFAKRSSEGLSKTYTNILCFARNFSFNSPPEETACFGISKAL